MMKREGMFSMTSLRARTRVKNDLSLRKIKKTCSY
jgi:hypothetical protein